MERKWFRAFQADFVYRIKTCGEWRHIGSNRTRKQEETWGAEKFMFMLHAQKDIQEEQVSIYLLMSENSCT